MRALHHLAACIIAGFGVTITPAFSQSYPARPLRIIVPTSSGSGGDLVARMVAQPLSERFGQQVVVENRAGASTIIGTDLVAKAAPDGYTLLMAVPAIAINPSMFRKLPYDAPRDLAPITRTAIAANLLVVHPSVPVTSVKQLIALANARPGEVLFASSGAGSNTHLAMELFLFLTQTRMGHIPYKGPAPGIIDLASGRVSAMATTIVGVMPHVRTGRLRALGVSTTQRIAILPEVPTIAEAGVPGYESSAWYGLLAPAGTLAEIIARLQGEVVAILQIQAIRARVAAEGMELGGSTPAEFAAFIQAESAKWAKVVKSAGIRPE